MDINGLFEGVMKIISQFADEIVEERIQKQMQESGRGLEPGGKRTDNFQAKRKEVCKISRNMSEQAESIGT